MLEKITEREHKRIDLEAERKKNIVSYIIDYINSDVVNVSKVFSPYIEKEFKNKIKALSSVSDGALDKLKEEFFENGLYENVRMMFKELDSNAVRTLGATFYGQESQTPDVELGLSKYNVMHMKTYNKMLTEKGVNIINGYREANGQYSIDETKEKNINAFLANHSQDF